MLVNMLEVCAREREQLPDNWIAYRFECCPSGGPRVLYYQITGAVCPLVTRGKRKGKPNYDEMDRATRRTLAIPKDEFEEWIKDWESRMGICSACEGSGKELAAAGTRNGEVYAEYRLCQKCKGEGKPVCAEEPAP